MPGGGKRWLGEYYSLSSERESFLFFFFLFKWVFKLKGMKTEKKKAQKKSLKVHVCTELKRADQQASSR